MTIRVPDALTDRVRWSFGVLHFRREAGPPLAAAAGWVAGVALADPGWRTFRVGRRGIRWGMLDRRMPHEGQYIRLTGEPGGPATLFVNGANDPLLHVEVQPPGRGPWSTQHLTWLGRTIAQLLDIPWRLEWDGEAWGRWNLDPSERACAALRRQLAISAKRYPTYYGYRLEEPPGEVTLERAVYTIRADLFDPVRLTLLPDELRSSTWTVPYAAVVDAGAVFRRRDGGSRPEAALVIATGEDTIDALRVPRASPLEGVYLQWLAEAILHRCHQYLDRDPGDAGDVPEALRQLRPADPP